MTKKGPVTMKFQSLSSDGIVTINATPEQKQYLTDVLDHYYLQKLITYGTPGVLTSYLDPITDPSRRSDWSVEDIINVIKKQEHTDTLQLPVRVVKDLHQLIYKTCGCSYLRDEESHIEETTKKLAQIVKKIDPEPEMKA